MLFIDFMKFRVGSRPVDRGLNRPVDRGSYAQAARQEKGWPVDRGESWPIDRKTSLLSELGTARAAGKLHG